LADRVPDGWSVERLGARHARLTRRQVDVAAWLPRGVSIREIARELVVSEATARSHVRSLMARTKTSNVTALAAWIVLHWQCCLYQEPSGRAGSLTESSSDVLKRNRHI
jgi:DNA-binding CsgD family transcriptional regulator